MTGKQHQTPVMGTITQNYVLRTAEEQGASSQMECTSPSVLGVCMLLNGTHNIVGKAENMFYFVGILSLLAVLNSSTL